MLNLISTLFLLRAKFLLNHLSTKHYTALFVSITQENGDEFKLWIIDVLTINPVVLKNL